MNIAVTNLIQNYHGFDREFWLSYKALQGTLPKDDFDKIKMILLKSKRVDLQVNKLDESTLAVYNSIKDSIDLEWRDKANKDKEEGTRVHEKIHELFVTNPTHLSEYNVPIELYLYILNENFLNTSKGCFSEYRLEHKLHDDYTLVGIADLILKDENNITIIDFKTGKDISFKSRYDFINKGDKKMKFPLNKYEDAKGIHYQLQLSLYAYMIELLNPDFKIKDLIIYHIKDKKLNLIHVDYLKDSIINLLDFHVNQLILQSNLNKCTELKY